MIDWDFETRLIDRIAARELIAARLNPLQRRVMARYYRLGETFEEVSEHEGYSRETIRHIVAGALRRLNTAPAEKPAPTKRATPPSGFDKAAFLRHMRGLIARRENEARDVFLCERAELEYLIARETPQPPPPKPPPPKPQPEVPVVWQHWLPPKVQPQVQAVEPWFDPAQTPTIEGMREIAYYAVGYFAAVRKSTAYGLMKIGTKVERVVCNRDADAICHGLNRLARQTPPWARLSAYPQTVPSGVLGASFANSAVALSVVAINGAQEVSIELTWHEMM